ncbi:MAG: ORF6N domain-containing protein, partial [Ruminococcus sp.]|nr:ORF6N domain-containing protein [Ruminococcus sp.]
MYELINGTPMPIREYNGQRVVTFKDIDSVHQRPDGTARRNFNKNRKHFIKCEDYFVRNSYEAKKEFGITAPNGLILITEYGYMMLVKSFEDELSWDVQRQLVNSYFRSKEQAPVTPLYADNLLLLHQKQNELVRNFCNLYIDKLEIMCYYKKRADKVLVTLYRQSQENATFLTLVSII